MSAEAPAPMPAQEAIHAPQDVIAPVNEITRAQEAGKRVLGGTVTETFDTFLLRTEASFSDYFKTKVGSTVDRLRVDLPEVAGMTIFGSTARGEAQYQKENGLSSDIDGTILIDIDKNPNLLEKVIRNDAAYSGIVKPVHSSLKMDLAYTLAIMDALTPSLREITGRTRDGKETDSKGDTVFEKDDIAIQPVSEQIIVEQIDAMCQTAQERKELQKQGVTDPEKLPYFASRNIRALFQLPISGEMSGYTNKVVEAFKAMEKVYGTEVRNTAWAMHAHGVNQFHDGRNAAAAPILETDFTKYESSLPRIESQATTTSNGSEIKYPTEKLTADGLNELIKEYGLEGSTPTERVTSLKNMPADKIALFMGDLNRKLQGSGETLVSDVTMNAGDQPMVAPEYRYDVFTSLIDKIKVAPAINPERLGDTLSLGIVLLHPFADGNGRTARVLASIFREHFNDNDYADDFRTLAEPRDEIRARGEFAVDGFVPYTGEGQDQTNPQVLSDYFDKLLSSDQPKLYNGPYGQVDLMKITA